MRRIKGAVVLSAAAIVVGGLAGMSPAGANGGSPASAVPPSSGSTVRSATIRAAALRAASRFRAAGTVHAADVLGTASVTDPTGDETAGGPNADITSVRIDYRTNTIKATIKTAGMANPLTDPGFLAGTSEVAAVFSPDNGVNVYILEESVTPPFGGEPAQMFGDLLHLSPQSEDDRGPTTFTFSPTNGYTLAAPATWLTNPPVPMAGGGLMIANNNQADIAPDSAPLGPVDPQPALPYWAGQDMARGVARPTTTTGYVLDAFGGLHPYSALGVPTPPAADVGGAHWGFKIARGVALMPDGSRGYILDGYGGLHPFALHGHAAPPSPTFAAYWKGWDIARGVAINPDGKGGYVVDGYGGLHAFAIGPTPRPAPAIGGAYWKGWNIARGVTIRSTGGGYILDGYGGLHAFTVNGVHAPAPVGGPYWRGWDIARGVDDQLVGGQGAIVDGYGGLHNFTG